MAARRLAADDDPVGVDVVVLGLAATTKRSAHSASSTAAGAGATRAIRYSTFTTFQPISSHGMMDMNDASLVPPIQPPP